MTRNHINRPTAGALTVALALGVAGPAAARPFDLDSQGSYVPTGHVQHYQKANVLAPCCVPALHEKHYGRANVLPPFVPGHVNGFPGTTAAPVATATPRAVVNHPAAGGSSDLIYIVVGGVVFAIGGLGGAFAVGRRQGARTTARARSTIAA
jgi:hypothetical protein